MAMKMDSNKIRRPRIRRNKITSKALLADPKLREDSDLTELEKMFIYNYTNYGSRTFQNGAGSIRSIKGPEYDPGNAAVYAVEMLKRPRILNAIQERIDKIFFHIDTDMERITSELAAIAHANISDIYGEDRLIRHPKDLPRHVSASIQSIKTLVNKNTNETLAILEIKMHDKSKALEGLIKLKGLVKDRLDIFHHAEEGMVDNDTKAKQTRMKLIEGLRKEEAEEAIIELQPMKATG